MTPATLALIHRVQSQRKAANLVAENGAHCATVAQRDYLNARHGLTREQITADLSRLEALRLAARESVK